MDIMDNGLAELSKADFVRLKILCAAEDLAKTESFTDLTIKDICDRMGVSRQTFYRHFKDKYDIAQWYWSLCAERGLKATGRTLTWQQGNMYMIEKLFEHIAFIQPALRVHDDYNALIEHGRRSRIAFLKETITDYRGLELTQDLAFQIEFFAEAESRFIAGFILKASPLSPSRLAELLEKCVPKELHDLLEVPQEKRSSTDC